VSRPFALGDHPILWGLGWPQLLTIIGLVGGLILTFWVMAKASVAYDKARKRREALAQQAEATEEGDTA
jgi:hypothetical protein